MYECKHGEDAGMHVCVCMHVYMHACMYACMYVWMPIAQHLDVAGFVKTPLLDLHLQGIDRLAVNARHELRCRLDLDVQPWRPLLQNDLGVLYLLEPVDLYFCELPAAQPASRILIDSHLRGSCAGRVGEPDWEVQHEREQSWDAGDFLESVQDGLLADGATDARSARVRKRKGGALRRTPNSSCAKAPARGRFPSTTRCRC